MRDGTAQPRPISSDENRTAGLQRPATVGFTIVELLVVIGIITVLIAILLPVLVKAREQARLTVCSSNIRQICQAMLLYANENRGVLPVVGGPIGRFEPPTSAIHMLDVGIYDWDRGTLWPEIPGGTATHRRIFNCPSDTAEPRLAGNADNVPDPNHPRNFSYNFAGALALDVRGLRLARVRRSSRKFFVLEMERPGGSVGAVVGIVPNPATDTGIVGLFLTTRHSGMAEIGFFDGHAELIDPKIFWHPGTTGATWAEVSYLYVDSNY